MFKHPINYYLYQNFISLIAGVAAITCLLSFQSVRALPAFPGAEGFGSSTPGGRGGRVIEVTNLNDSGPGSFREAVTASEPRIVVFRVAGTISLKSQVQIDNPFLTIAGQTAPGDGITIKVDSSVNGKMPIKISTNDVIVRYLRVRPGPSPLDIGNLDALDIDSAKNVIIDHCSFSWATDEVVTIAASNNVTVQWSIIAEGLNNATHPEGAHSKGLHLRESNTGNISLHHNLLAHNYDRNPNITPDGVVDFVNNIIYDGTRLTEMKDKFGEPRANIVGNYYKPGPGTVSTKYEVFYYSSTNSHPKVYVKGNIGPHRLSDSLPEEDIVQPIDRWMIELIRFDTPIITTTSAFTAYEQVLAKVGATLPVRDAHDLRVINDVKNRTGKLIDNPSEVGGWLVMKSGTIASDSDRDGMSDSYEILKGLDPKDPSDGRKFASSGYTNVEEYLNGLTGESGTEPKPTATPTPTPSPKPVGGSISIKVSEDASVLQSHPNSNYGTNTSLQTDNSPVEQFLVKFNVSGISGKSIKSVKLRLYNKNSSEKGGSFYKVNNNTWTEKSVTFNTAPAHESVPLASLGKVSSGNWYEIDLTALINANGVYSLKGISTNSDGADYASKEKGSSYAPYLLITFN